MKELFKCVKCGDVDKYANPHLDDRGYICGERISNLTGVDLFISNLRNYLFTVKKFKELGDLNWYTLSKDGKSIVVVIDDYGKNGFDVYIQSPHNNIDKDIELIKDLIQ